MAEVFFLTIDASCQSEVIALRVKIGTGEGARNVDPSKCDDLAEDVRERVHRE